MWCMRCPRAPVAPGAPADLPILGKAPIPSGRKVGQVRRRGMRRPLHNPPGLSMGDAGGRGFRRHRGASERTNRQIGAEGGHLPVSMRPQARRVAKRSSEVLRAELAVAEEKLDMRVSELELRVAEVEERLASQEEPAERKDVSQSALAGGLVVFLLCAWLLRERRRSLSD